MNISSNYEGGDLPVSVKKLIMTKTEIKEKNFLTSYIRINGFNQIIPFFADSNYIFKRSDVFTELALTLVITQLVITAILTII